MQTPGRPAEGVTCPQGARGAHTGSNPAARISGTGGAGCGLPGGGGALYKGWALPLICYGNPDSCR